VSGRRRAWLGAGGKGLFHLVPKLLLEDAYRRQAPLGNQKDSVYFSYPGFLLKADG